MARRLSDRAAVFQTPIQEMLEYKKSMLGNTLPREYGLVETTQEALRMAVPPPKVAKLRMTIIWDNEVTSLDLERVLDHMRETGAAMVLKVEEVT